MTATTGGTTGAGGPVARRLRQPSWRDPRLLIGLVLVLASVGFGARVVAAADRTAPVYVARAALPAGTRLKAADLAVARLRLGEASARYLDGARPVPAGVVLGRTVGAGELVPAGALVEAAALAARPVTVPMPDGVPAGLVAGGRVDVWSVADPDAANTRSRSATTTSTAPRRIAADVEVYHVQAPAREGAGSGRGSAVQVLVPEAALPVVLTALAADGSLQLLPVPG